MGFEAAIDEPRTIERRFERVGLETEKEKEHERKRNRQRDNESHSTDNEKFDENFDDKHADFDVTRDSFDVHESDV